jgi:hypothetical protein
MHENLIDIFFRYPYLFACILNLVLCLAVCLPMGAHGRFALLVGLVNTSGFFLVVCLEGAYWSPVRLGNWRLGIEDMLCSFDVGVGAWLAAAIPFQGRIGLAHPRDLIWWRFILIAAVTFPGFMAMVYAGLNPMTSLVLTCLISSAVVLLFRRDVLVLGLVGAPVYAVVYYIIAMVNFLIWPDFLNQWRADSFWGVLILGLPLGEITGAFFFGLFWPMFVVYVFDISFLDVRRAQKTPSQIMSRVRLNGN